jgi:hypothetical protein
MGFLCRRRCSGEEILGQAFNIFSAVSIGVSSVEVLISI